MDRNQICKELIKVANQLDKDGNYNLANELTKTAAEIINSIRKAQAQPTTQQATTQQAPTAQPATQQTPTAQFQPSNVDPRYDYLKRAIESGNIDYIGQALNYFGGYAARQYNRLNQYKSTITNYQNSVISEAKKIYNQYAYRNKLPQVETLVPIQQQNVQTAPAPTAQAQPTAQPTTPR